MVTLNPLAFSNMPREAETIPFPNDDVTPPVTKMYLVLFLDIRLGLCKVKIKRHIMQETNYKVSETKSNSYLIKYF